MLVCFNLKRNGTGNGLSNTEDTFANGFQVQISAFHQIMFKFKAGLPSLIDGWAKYQEKVTDMSDSNQNIKTTCNSKLKFAKLKGLLIKRVQKN